MAQAGKTFRIFVSSTFSDLKEERNALQQYVFPRLRDLCMQNGARFQAIDLRWGVSEEAGLDQRTMNICLDEIDRCRKITPRPNFVLLLGDRYGWRPLPPQIPANEFDEICERISTEEQERLREWYLRDDNAVPPEYCLKPREPGGPFEDFYTWEDEVERPLRSILLKAVKDMPLEIADRLKFEASATEQEIDRGAMRVPDAHEHVYCFFRTITDLLLEEAAKDFVDFETKRDQVVKENGECKLDEDARRRIDALKGKLRGRFPAHNIHDYNAQWTDEGVTTDHIGTLPETLDECLKLNEGDQAPSTLCVDVWKELSRIILQEIDRMEDVDPLDKEIKDHDNFAEDRARNFIGRAAILEAIANYVRRADRHPLAIHGVSGSGKSALMARAMHQARTGRADAEVMVRFIGATPESSDGRALLQSLCLQIARRYAPDEATVPASYRELVDEFPKRLALATAERPLIIFLDALDQLSDAEGARSLVWLPAELPENVRVVLTTLPRESLSALENKLPGENIVELKPMPLDEGNELLDLWLKDADRVLQPHQRKEVLDEFNLNGLPLYLKLAFEEARRWKSYTDRSKTDLNPDVTGIIRDLFKRLADPANHGPLIVERSLAYLRAAKNGLSEDEMIDLLSLDDEIFKDFKEHVRHDLPEMEDRKKRRLPVVIWSRLYLDLEPYLTERSADAASLLAFYHRQLGDVVDAEYLEGDERLARHRLLSEYFGDAPLEIERADGALPNLRKLSELPYQQTMGELWEQLHDTLTDFRFLETKAATGAVETADAEGNKTATYSGPFFLQEDFRLALEKFPAS